jgi:hypothetical protein
MEISVLGYIFKSFPKWAIAFILSGLFNPFSCTLQGQNAFPGAIGFGAGASGGEEWTGNICHKSQHQWVWIIGTHSIK